MLTADPHSQHPLDPTSHREKLLALLEPIEPRPLWDRHPRRLAAAPPLQHSTAEILIAGQVACGWLFLAAKILVESFALTFLVLAFLHNGMGLDTTIPPIQAGARVLLIAFWTWRSLHLGVPYLPTEMTRSEDLLSGLTAARRRGRAAFGLG